MSKPKEATTYEECLAAVRYLSSKHHYPAAPPPQRKKRKATLAEIIGWKATPQLLDLFQRKRIAI